MPQGHPVNLDAFHNLLFRRADRHGRVLLRQSKLAKELGLTKFTMSRVVTRMVASQRMRQITNSKQHAGYFSIEDPDVWNAVHVVDDDDDI